jgi:hypothetical protein
MFMSIEGNYGRWLGVVGEFSGTFAMTRPRFFGDPAAGTASFLTGPRLTCLLVRGLVPFGQILIGVGSSGGDGVRYSAMAIQPGAGIDIRVHQHVAVRIASDRRYLLGIRTAAGTRASLAELRAGLVLY